MDSSIQLDNLSPSSKARLTKKAQTFPQIQDHNASENSEVAHMLPASEAHNLLSTSTADCDEIDSEDPVPQNSSPGRPRRTVSHFWLAEFLSWVIASGIFVAIAILLFTFDGHQAPDWPYGITLGALVSLLATIAIFLLTVPVTSGLGQIKWIWFRSEQHEIIDFEVIEEAGRGPMGSFMLLLKWRGGLLAVIGALTIISIQAVGPFFQQIIHYSSHNINVAEATIPAASQYKNNYPSDLISTDLDLTMKAAIQNGALNIESNTTAFDVTPQCSTGNCTYPPFESLAMCYACADLTDKLTLRISSDGLSNFSALPNNLSLQSQWWMSREGLIQMTVNNSATDQLESIAFKGYGYPLVDMFVILAPYTNGGGEITVGPYASECIIQWCVKQYTAEVKNGTFHETTTSKIWLFDSAGSSIVGLRDNGTNFTVDYESGENAMIEYFGNLFSGQVAQSNSLSPMQEWPSDATQAIFHYLNGTNHRLDGMFNNLVMSMTQNIRTRSNADHTIRGYASLDQSIIKIEWPWITLPLVVLILVLGFLIAVSIKTQQVGLEPWKSSSIATLFHGLNAKSFSDLRAIRTIHAMDATAGRLAVRLDEDSDGLGLLAGRSSGL